MKQPEKHIFVIGLDELHRELLQTVRGAEHYHFHGLLDYTEVVNPSRYDIEGMIAQGKRQLERFGATVDAIIGHWDFPTTALLALFRRHLGLPGPTLASTLIAEHKYWCRLRQRQVIPAQTPQFQAVNPFDSDAAERVDLDYPFWLKPTIAYSSQLAFYIGNRRQLDEALAATRARIGLFGEPFRLFRERCVLPADIPAEVDAFWCIAEAPIEGEQCTVEGYIRGGEPHVYAVIDSFREGLYNSSFSRYQLPSQLPQPVQERIIEAALRTVPALELDDTTFNIEFFWDPQRDLIRLLEVNPRLSKSHSPLFVSTTGASHHEVAIDIALGREPNYPRREGCCAVAAKFMLRRHADAIVSRTPTEDELRGLQERYPGTLIEIAVEKGMRLSELRGQDAYSYEVAAIFMGAADNTTLEQRYEELIAELPLEFDEEAVK
ncbi:MAG: ATP-grasp domain-containing protein [Pseudomonadota bacterium]